MEEKIGFIGAGTVATTFAVKLTEGGYPVVAVSDIKPAMAQRMADLVKGCQIYDTNQGVVEAADLVIIATWDQAMVPAINQINWRPDKGVVHTSGFFGTDILEPAKRTGARVGGFHPAQLFANLDQALGALPGSTFCLLGEPPLLDTLKEMVSAIKCDWIVLKPTEKPLYHVALAFSTDFPMVCVKICTELFQKLGVSQTETIKVITPLIRGTVDGILNLGFPDCFSGPITRGDLSVLSKHVATLAENEPGLVELFKELDRHIVPMALAKGTIDEATANKERAILRKA
jgi:predicted short-subunit dehydrogenase-like oxidoreductase (DUF2520 family)